MSEIRVFDLTPQQCAILNELGRRHEYKLIARDLGISENSVKKQLQRAYRKLAVASRDDAVKRHQRQKNWNAHVCGAGAGHDNGELDLSPEEVVDG